VKFVQHSAKLFVYLSLFAVSSGCVGTVYAVKANAAAAKLETARTLSAHKLAEFEYWYAQAHLTKAQEQAAEASYGDAIHYADVAEEYADKAIELSRDSHRGAGR